MRIIDDLKIRSLTLSNTIPSTQQQHPLYRPHIPPTSEACPKRVAAQPEVNDKVSCNLPSLKNSEITTQTLSYCNITQAHYTTITLLTGWPTVV
jgi:hypothetical protein